MIFALALYLLQALAETFKAYGLSHTTSLAKAAVLYGAFWPLRSLSEVWFWCRMFVGRAIKKRQRKSWKNKHEASDWWGYPES